MKRFSSGMTELVSTAEKSVKKHVAAIHISNKISFLERKISNALLWNAYDELLLQKRHRIRVKDLMEIIGFESNNRTALKQAMKNLMSTVLEWNVIDERGREKEWEACTMLADAGMKGAYCYYSYSEELRKKLYNPEVYERINLSIQRKLSSGYSLALYENCVRFRKTGVTGWIDLSDFRLIMGVDPKEYQDFRRLNTRVIKGPVDQVNGSSDIMLVAEYKREKRRVIAVRFKIKENPQLSLFRNKEEAGGEKSSREEKEEVKKRLLLFGVSDRQAERAIESYEASYISENLKLVEQQYLAGKVGNLPAYTLMALKTDYRPKISPYEAAKKEKSKERRDRLREEKKQREEIGELRQKWEAGVLAGKLKKMTREERDRLEKGFHEESLENPLYQRYQASGPENPIIKSMFRAFAYRELMEDVTEEDFKAYLGQRERETQQAA